MPKSLQLVALIVLAAVMLFGPAEARSSHGHGSGTLRSGRSHGGGSHHGRSSSPRHSAHSYSGGHRGGRATALAGVPSDSHADVKRSESASAFRERRLAIRTAFLATSWQQARRPESSQTFPRP